MPKKKHDPKAKAKRQKIIAGVGGVLLLGLLAFQVPKTLKMLNQNQNAQTTTSATTTTASSGSAPLAPPSLAGSPVGTSTASSGGSSSQYPTGSAPAAAAGQLVSFNRFPSKDPFMQQVDASCLTASADSGGSAASSTGDSGSGSGSSSSSSSSASSASSSSGSDSSACAASSSKTPASSTPSASTPSSTSTVSSSSSLPTVQSPDKGTGLVNGSSTSGTTGSATRLTTATISVDGVSELVKTGASFPQAQPIFRLVALTAKSAKLAIVNGSLETGAPTVVLAKGQKLTLMNTADGTRYTLVLLAAAP